MKIAYNGDVTIGLLGVGEPNGNLGLIGHTSGSAITFKVNASTAAYDFLLPAAAPAADTVLYSSAGGSTALSWITQSALVVGNSTNATNTTYVDVTDDTTTNAVMYPLWVTSSGGYRAAKTSTSKLSFNPSTGALTATSFVGSIPAPSLTTTYVGYGAAGVLSGNSEFTYKNSGINNFTVGFSSFGKAIDIQLFGSSRDYKFGNIAGGGSGNSSTIYINDTTKALTYSDFVGTWLNLDGTNKTFEIGDCFAAGLSTKVSVDDNSSIIYLIANIVNSTSLVGTGDSAIGTTSTGNFKRLALVPVTNIAALTDTVYANTSVVVLRKYKINTGIKIKIEALGILRIL